MDLIYPNAEWRGPTPNQGGPDVESRGLVVHIAEGSYEGTISWQRNDISDVSSEFVIAKSGRVAQMMPVQLTAWTQRVGNGHWDSVECEGRAGESLTPAQIEGIAQIFAWGHTVRGWPLQVATSPSGRGLGHHSMGPESGVDWGHSQCPGEPIKSQKPAIVARAAEIINGNTEDDMPPVFVWSSNKLYVVDGGFYTHVEDSSGWQKVFAQRGWDWKLIEGGREVTVTPKALESMGRDAALYGSPSYRIELSGATGTAVPA